MVVVGGSAAAPRNVNGAPWNATTSMSQTCQKQPTTVMQLQIRRGDPRNAANRLHLI